MSPRKTRQLTHADLINAESELGRTIFGPVLPEVQREFFTPSKNIWIWHEAGITTRYEVRPHGVFKKHGNGHYAKLTGTELTNFRTATRRYLELVKSHLYN